MCCEFPVFSSPSLSNFYSVGRAESASLLLKKTLLPHPPLPMPSLPRCCAAAACPSSGKGVVGAGGRLVGAEFARQQGNKVFFSHSHSFLNIFSLPSAGLFLGWEGRTATTNLDLNTPFVRRASTCVVCNDTAQVAARADSQAVFTFLLFRQCFACVVERRRKDGKKRRGCSGS